jgi:O-antigen/teichoic acid export membrane protein
LASFIGKKQIRYDLESFFVYLVYFVVQFFLVALSEKFTMSRKPFWKFVLSWDALEAHLIFGGLILLLSYSLLAGEAQADYGWGLLFAVCAYPVVLGLMWWQERADEQAAIEHEEKSKSAPERLRRERQMWRQSSLVCIAAAAIALVYFGRQGMVIEFLPAHYLGYFLMALAVLGMSGVNIWHGGPLDPRMDPPPSETNDESPSAS